MLSKDEIKRLGDKAAETNNQSIETTDISRPINWSRWADYPDFNKVLDALVEEVILSKDNTRGASARTRGSLRNIIGALIINLYEARHSHPLGTVGLCRDKNIYSRNGNYCKTIHFYQKAHLSHRFVVETAADQLISLDYITTTRNGFYNRDLGWGESTRIRATDKLITLLNNTANLTPRRIIQRTDTPSVILRDRDEKNDKHNIIYSPNKQTRQWERELDIINDCLESAWLDLHITDAEFDELQKRQYNSHLSDNEKAPCIDLNANRLRRIFNNKDFKQGGRFYGGWWQNIPSEYRKHIHINGKDTVEIDYSSMHPVILYRQAGVDCPNDPYHMDLEHVARHHRKTAFNALLNATGALPNQPNDYNAEEQNMSWQELLNHVHTYHHPIQDSFQTGAGLYLQRIDADIATKVMLHFAKSGYPCLPVHDSFIVHHALADDLHKVMLSAFCEEVGIVPKADIKDRIQIKAPYPAHEVDMEDLSFLDNDGPYSRYQMRERDWHQSL